MDVLCTSWRHSLSLLFRTASEWGISVTTLIVFRVASVSGRHVATNFPVNGTVFRNELCSRDCARSDMLPSKVRRLWTRQCCGAGRRKLELSLACCTLAATSAELVCQGCVVLWHRHHGMGERVANEPTTWRPSHMCASDVFTGGTAMIQGMGEHVANDLTELFPQLENKEVAASPERKYSLMS